MGILILNYIFFKYMFWFYIRGASSISFMRMSHSINVNAVMEMTSPLSPPEVSCLRRNISSIAHDQSVGIIRVYYSDACIYF